MAILHPEKDLTQPFPPAKSHLQDLIRISPGGRKGFLRLDMNESVQGLPVAFVRKVLEEFTPEYLATYPDYTSLKNKIAAHNHLAAENICLANGSDAAIKYIFETYVAARDTVLLTDPTFAMYHVYGEMFQAQSIVIKYNDDLTFPKRQFYRALGRNIKLAVIVNPNNPTGDALAAAELMPILHIASEHNVLLIIDEAYFYFHPETVIEAVKNYNNLIVLRTFSKLCGLAATRVGYAAACPEIIGHLKKVRPTFDINNLAVLFAERILDRKEIIGELIDITAQGKEFLVKRMQEMGIEYVNGRGNFILINCHDRANEIMKKLNERMILVGGGFKQSFLQNYIRVTIGDKASMDKFWEAFINIWRL